MYTDYHNINVFPCTVHKSKRLTFIYDRFVLIVTLSGTETFRGFLVIAHAPGQNGMLLGRFIPRNSNQQTLDCDAVGAATQATVTHSNSGLTQFSSMTFTWEAPAGADGMVDFRLIVIYILLLYNSTTFCANACG